MNEQTNKSTPVDPIVHREALGQEESKLHYTSEYYQKVLDYHVSEIILTTIIFGVILLLRLHR